MGDNVFICYSRKDEGFALKLATNLKNQGVPIWLDQWDIPTGANWDRTIEKALDESNRLLLILSPSSTNSDEVQCEWREALDDKKVVVPILYQPCEIPYRLNTIQYIDFTSRSPDDEEAIGQILNALGKARPTLKKIVKKPEKTPERHQYPHIKIIAIAVLAILVVAAVLWFPRGLPPNEAPTLIQKGLDSRQLNKEGIDLDGQGKYDEAIQAYDAAIRLDPNAAPVWINKGKDLSKLGKYDEAIQAFDTAIRLEPTLARYRMYKGDALFHQNKYDEAIQAYDEAIRLAPNDTLAWKQKGNTLFAQKKYDEAIQAYDEAIRLDPKYAQAWQNKGDALFHQNKYDEADVAYAKAMELGYNPTQYV